MSSLEERVAELEKQVAELYKQIEWSANKITFIPGQPVLTTDATEFTDTLFDK